jgi:predicted permease
MGRRAPGATAEQVRATLEPVFQQAAKDGWLTEGGSSDTKRPMPSAPTLRADPGGQGENDLRQQYAPSMRMLLGLVGLVLAAACANVANLLLARDVARQREIAVRLALGASRGRIVRQLMIESLLLAVVGTTLGIVLAWTCRGLLLALQPFGTTTVILDLPLDARVLAFTAVVTVTTAVLFGLAPALKATRLDLNAQFQGGARLQGSARGSRLSGALMVVQVGLSLVLLIGTGLFVRTLVNLERVSAGFNRQDLILFRIDAASAGYPRAAHTSLQAHLQERLSRVPGVRSATFSSTALLSRVRQNRRITVPGSTAPEPPIVNTNGLASNFFETMELPLLLGRGFDARDDETSQKVAIVNQAFVRQYGGGQNPVGQTIGISMGGDRVEIVGVAADGKYTDLRSPAPPTVYVPSLQQIDGNANFAVRVDRGVPVPALFASIRAAVHDIDPALPVLDLRTQDEQIDRLHAQERFFARLSGLFGTIVLVLACVGLYGLMSHTVLRRTGEIGLRMALGAQPAGVLRMVLRQSLALVSAGILLGAAGALAAGRLVQTMLFGLSPADPLTYVAMAAMLVVVSCVAALVPARRASRIDPLVALRSE